MAVLSLFRKNKDVGVASFLTKLANTYCLNHKAMPDDSRANRRGVLVTVLRIIPVEENQILIQQAFTTVTKEISNLGVSVVLDQPRGLKDAILAFRFQGDMVYIRADAKHLNPMGGGFFQLGFRLIEIISPGDYPELKKVSL